jgi:hypothetical protein
MSSHSLNILSPLKPSSAGSTKQLFVRQRSHSFDDKNDFIEEKNRKKSANDQSPRSIHSSTSPRPTHTLTHTPTTTQTSTPTPTLTTPRPLFSRQRSRSFDSKEDIEKLNISQRGNENLTKPSGTSTSTSTPATRRILRRVESRDDQMVAPMTQSSSSSSLPVVSPRASTSTPTSTPLAKDDSALTRGTHAVKSNVQMSFIRVYVGFKTFYPRNKTVVVAIFYQPTLQVYEVVIIDPVDEKEVSRMYLYQTEIVLQLRRRNAVKSQKEQSKPSPSQLPGLLLAPIERPGSRQSRAKKTVKKIRRRTEQDLVKTEVYKWQNIKEDTEYRQNAEDEIDLDTVDIHAFNSKSLSQLLFPKVLLKCLQTDKAGGVDDQYRFVNEKLQSQFQTYSSIPEGLKTLLPTYIDATVLIAQAKSVISVKNATDSLKQTVNAAGSFTEHTRADLQVMNDVPVRSYKDEEKLNPNVLKWRMLWQFAISTVMKQNRIAKQIRQNWGFAVQGAIVDKQEKEEAAQAVITQQRPAGFRKLRTRRHGLSSQSESSLCGEMPLSVADMSQYREEMASRRQLKKEKSRKIMNM